MVLIRLLLWWQHCTNLKISEVYQLCTRLLEEGKQVAMALPDTIVEDIMHIYAGYPDHMGTSMYYDVINHQPPVEAIQGFILPSG